VGKLLYRIWKVNTRTNAERMGTWLATVVWLCKGIMVATVSSPAFKRVESRVGDGVNEWGKSERTFGHTMAMRRPARMSRA